MNPNIKSQSRKVGHLFIENLAHSFNSAYSHIFDEDMILTLSNESSLPLDKLDESVWLEWVGSIEWDSLKRSNAVLEVQMESKNPEIQDQENVELLDKIQTAWVALKFVAPLYTNHCYKTSGYFEQEKIRINHYEPLHKWYLPGFNDLYENEIGTIERMDVDRVVQWAALYKTLRFIKSRRKAKEYDRLWFGLRSFEKACGEYYLEYRLPFFVRSLEALIMPEKGNTTTRFKSRASKWWSKNINLKAFVGDPQKILGEIYEMRCDFDHLHGLKEQYSEKQYLLAYQCEQLARSAYRNILLEEGELGNFITNKHIYAYWANLGTKEKPSFISNPNPEKNFGGGKLYQDIQKMLFDEAVIAFEKRIKSWFLDPANPLIREGETSIPNGFQVTQASCIVIDVLSQYINDLPASRATEYIEFLKGLDPLFQEIVDPPIESWSYKNNSLVPRPESIDTLAKGFYHAFRCGIIHGAMIMDYGRISGEPVAPQLVQLRSWNGHREIAVNPTLLFNVVVKRFDAYILELLNSDNRKLRERFRNKFFRDFGIKLSF